MNLSAIGEFRTFVSQEILPAAKDLQRLEDRNRKHIQKLIYTNLVDRFDSMIDQALLDNCREPGLLKLSTQNMSGTITEADLVSLLLEAENIQGALENKLREGLRQEVLRQRHSRKLSTLVSALANEQEVWNMPRVTISTGRILAKVTPTKNSKVPHSICGFADWLYSRRNTVVHGNGSPDFLLNDKTQLQKLFKCEPAQRVRIQLSSTTTAAAFYLDVANLLDS